MTQDPAGVLVIGGGVAGLSAALAAAEETGGRVRVVLLDRAPESEAGGNTRWTDAYFRLQDVYEPAENFVEDMLSFSGGKTDRGYVETLVDLLPDTMEWVQSHGVRFQRRATYFVTASRPRMMPAGGGEALVRHLTAACLDAGVEVRHAVSATELRGTGAGYDVTCRGEDETTEVIRCRALVIASGGFEGDPEMMARHIGPAARTMAPIAPGGRFNTGDVIEQAVALGAATDGEFTNFHGEPVDARSRQAEASVMVFPYGLVVDSEARRFVDEGVGTVDESYEDLARAILARPDSRAYFVSDASFDKIPGIERGLLTDLSPLRADSLSELAQTLGLDGSALEATVAAFNGAVVDGPFDPLGLDGKHTEGIEPPKSNWAVPIQEPPFLGIPLTTAIVFTYGGLKVNPQAQVVDGGDQPVPGLYAAGECTGIYHRKYPGATSVMRGLVYGRVAGRRAAQEAESAG